MTPRLIALAAIVVAASILLAGCSPPPAATAECDAAFETAASVEGLNNDVELSATADACADTDDWVRGIQANPGAGSLTSYTTSDAYYLLNLLCVERPDSRVCADAAIEGVLER